MYESTMVKNVLFPLQKTTEAKLNKIIEIDKSLLNPKNPKSDQHLISPYSKTVEPFINITRIKEMIGNLRSFNCKRINLVSAKGKYRKGY